MSARLYTCRIPFGGGTLTVTADLEPLTGPPDDCTIMNIELDDVQEEAADGINFDVVRNRVMALAREDWHSRQHDRAESAFDTREEAKRG
jgi:hypothetical protein